MTGTFGPLPGAALYPPSSRPRPARVEDDGREWITGMCWLYCRRSGIPVIWLGPVTSSGMQAPLYGCQECIAELDHMFWTYLVANDRP